MPDRVALYLQDAHELQDAISYVQYAESRNFEAVWQAESRLVRDAVVPMAATGEPLTGQSLPPMTTRSEPLASKAPEAPSDCEARARPPRVKPARPPYLMPATAHPVFDPRVTMPTVWIAPVEFLEAWGGPMRRIPSEATDRPSCAPLDRGRVAHALAEVDVSSCAVEGEAPCGTLRITIEPTGHISKVEHALGGASTKTSECVRRYMSSHMIRFDMPSCSTVTLGWTYFVDR